MNTLRLPLLFALGVLLGVFSVILLPLILTAYLTDLWARIAGTPVRCDGGDPSPTEEDDTCRHGVNPSDNCLMCAIEAPDDDEPSTGLLEAVVREEWVTAVELWLEGKKGKKA
jgi:hypothetical protein